jgi:hypothetical protein
VRDKGSWEWRWLEGEGCWLVLSSRAEGRALEEGTKGGMEFVRENIVGCGNFSVK